MSIKYNIVVWLSISFEYWILLISFEGKGGIWVYVYVREIFIYIFIIIEDYSIYILDENKFFKFSVLVVFKNSLCLVI